MHRAGTQYRHAAATRLVVQTVLRAEGTDQLLRLAQIVARQHGEEVVLNLAVQPAREPARRAAQTQ